MAFYSVLSNSILFHIYFLDIFKNTVKVNVHRFSKCMKNFSLKTKGWKI